jgi:dCTP diphosphatase
MKQRTVPSITRKILKFRDARRWKKFHNPKDMAIAITLEASELLEHFLWKDPQECKERIRKQKAEIRDEIADIAVYLFELAHNLDINLLEAMDEKLEKNARKYPVSKAKGSNKKYTEL